MDATNDLNQAQRKAATAGDGAVMIVAGPGTGKTKTLTARIAHLIASGRTQPERILALTFTKKAAEEMRQRTAAQTGKPVPHIMTFHALCGRLLQDEKPFVTEANRLQIIKNVPCPKDLKGKSPRELGLLISRAKNQPHIDDPVLARLVRAYNKELIAQGLRDFDDLLAETYDMLQQPQAQAAVRAQYDHVLVDEFQDTSPLQYELLKLLAGTDNIFVIGDPNQSIYGFRGASGTVFDQFRADFPKARAVQLSINYRSVPEVVHLSNAVFDGQPGLVPYINTGGAARAVQVLNEYGEAAWVLCEIQRAIGGGDLLNAVSDDDRQNHRRLNDFAVLYRSRPAAMAFQKVLDESGLPYQVVGDGSPYEHPHIQAIIGLLREGASHEPVQLEGYGSAVHRLLVEMLDGAEDAVPSVLSAKIVATLGLGMSPEVQQFLSVMARFKRVPEALTYIDTIAVDGFYDPSADAITLMTIHASKGLEFPYVFLLGAEEGMLPSARGDEAEEKRLFYVAVTRARERLDITHAKNRGGQPAAASRFVTGLPAAILPRYADPEMEAQVRRIAKRAAKQSQQTLF